MQLDNPEYDGEFLMQRIAQESPTFKSYLAGLLKDTDSDFPTNEVWLGTLALGVNKVESQIKLTVTQESPLFIDEEDLN